MPPTRPPGPTLGLEEELHVVGAGDGRLVSRAPELLERLQGEDVSATFARHGAVVAELTLSQVETVTAVAGSVPGLLEHAAVLRRRAALVAAEHDLALVASGTPVLGDADEQRVADDERYATLRARAAGLIDQQLIAGMHVHVGLDGEAAVGDVDDDVRAAVVDGLRPWLPALLALSANSPFWLGRDTGFASWRQVHWQRWPVAGPPPRVGDAAGWRRAVERLVAAGVVDDASYVYWDVRLATRFPTVEVRVADVALTLADAGTYVGLVRALAQRSALDHERGVAGPDVPLHALRAAMWRAARYGVEDALVDPTSGTLAPASDVLRALLEQAGPGLEVTGDGDLVREGLGRVLRDGNGASRQRRAFAARGWAGVRSLVTVDPDAAWFAAGPGDGNGWVDCVCGQRHWGRNGAAGLLVARPGPSGPEVLLQLRAGWTHQGGTWGVPGGARDSHESVADAARRETEEEAGLDPAAVRLTAELVDDHGPWSYTYVVGRAPAGTAAAATNRESDEVRWVPLGQVTQRPLHPGLAAAWPRLLDLVRDETGPVAGLEL
jgi:carboxylate-amine ligase